MTTHRGLRERAAEDRHVHEVQVHILAVQAEEALQEGLEAFRRRVRRAAHREDEPSAVRSLFAWTRGGLLRQIWRDLFHELHVNLVAELPKAAPLVEELVRRGFGVVRAAVLHHAHHVLEEVGFD